MLLSLLLCRPFLINTVGVFMTDAVSTLVVLPGGTEFSLYFLTRSVAASTVSSECSSIISEGCFSLDCGRCCS